MNIIWGLSQKKLHSCNEKLLIFLQFYYFINFQFHKEFQLYLIFESNSIFLVDQLLDSLLLRCCFIRLFIAIILIIIIIKTTITITDIISYFHYLLKLNY